MKFMFLQDFTKNSINGTTECQKLITADKNEKRGSFKILDKNKKKCKRLQEYPYIQKVYPVQCLISDL